MDFLCFSFSRVKVDQKVMFLDGKKNANNYQIEKKNNNIRSNIFNGHSNSFNFMFNILFHKFTCLYKRDGGLHTCSTALFFNGLI